MAMDFSVSGDDLKEDREFLDKVTHQLMVRRATELENRVVTFLNDNGLRPDEASLIHIVGTGETFPVKNSDLPQLWRLPVMEALL